MKNYNLEAENWAKASLGIVMLALMWWGVMLLMSNNYSEQPNLLLLSLVPFLSAFLCSIISIHIEGTNLGHVVLFINISLLVIMAIITFIILFGDYIV